jgi:hypothetical protein
MFDLLHPIVALNRLIQSPSYGESLEQFILTRHPKDTGDIERLTEEWNRAQSGGWFK